MDSSETILNFTCCLHNQNMFAIFFFCIMLVFKHECFRGKCASGHFVFHEVPTAIKDNDLAQHYAILSLNKSDSYQVVMKTHLGIFYVAQNQKTK
jgi:hypothetical protein